MHYVCLVLGEIANERSGGKWDRRFAETLELVKYRFLKRDVELGEVDARVIGEGDRAAHRE